MDIGVQLYTLRDYTKTASELDKTLAFLQELGVNCVQASGLGYFPVETKKELFDKYNMKVCATHNSYDRFLSDLDGIIAEQKLLGVQVAGLGSAPVNCDITRFLNAFNKIAERLKEEGLQFAYHNHGHEFKKAKDGTTFMQHLITDTDKDNFHFIADLCWTKIAKQDQSQFLNSIKDRVDVVHIKDYKKTLFSQKFVTLTQGIGNVEECVKLSIQNNVPYIVYEQDSGFINKDAKQEVKLSYPILKDIFTKYSK